MERKSVGIMKFPCFLEETPSEIHIDSRMRQMTLKNLPVLTVPLLSELNTSFCQGKLAVLKVVWCGGWLRNPASPKGWLKPYVEIMGCLPPINWCRISQPSTVLPISSRPMAPCQEGGCPTRRSGCPASEQDFKIWSNKPQTWYITSDMYICIYIYIYI